MTITMIVRTIKCDIRSMNIGVQFIKSDLENKDSAYFTAIKQYIANFQMRDWSDNKADLIN
jgi:hypothetical protein